MKFIPFVVSFLGRMKALKLGLGSNELTEPILSIENVTEYFMHPGYNFAVKHHDIALVKLPARVEQQGLYSSQVALKDRNSFWLTFVFFFFSDTIKVLQLPVSIDNATYTNSIARVSGFGRYKNDQPVVSRKLLWTFVKVISNEQCTRVYGEKVIINSTLCAESSLGAGQNTCGGDSGGGLVKFENGKFRHIGVAVFAATDNCGAGYPSGFMRTRSYLQWIYSTVLSESIKKP